MNTLATRLASVQVVETPLGITLFGFDDDEACVMSRQGLEDDAVGSLHATVEAALNGELACNTSAAESAALYDLLTAGEEGWEVIVEHDGDQFFAYEEDMGRVALRILGGGYVLGLLHLKAEGNWFEHAGEGSIWQYVFRSPIEAEAALDELGQDCEIHSVADLLARGCVLV
ncbi:hypothetical protein [Uliginosibacterium sediminicola]|uniref:Uncharacterized protein n=1 Tax=Uliginosibacterium sediminicola TaxID=2024550 RepID=A0ABU9Z2N3_9RHOO